MSEQMTITRAGDVLVSGRKVGFIVREPSVAPPNWTVISDDGFVLAWHYLRRDAVEDAKRRFA